MKKIYFLALLMAVGNISSAQFTYNFSTLSGQTYTQLTGSTSVTANLIWDDEYLSVPMPFTMNIAGRSTSVLDLELGMAGILTDTQNTVNGLFISDADLVDRGNFTSVASSPVSYVTTGSAPNRIFKLEFRNAGFYDDMNGNDFINVQVWLYETGVIEYHYGTSQVTTPGDYYQYTNGPMNGIIKNYDLVADEVEKFYYLKGSPAAPSLDSVDVNGNITTALASTPAAGTVYRFAPKVAQGVGSLAKLTNMVVYPTNARNELNVNYQENVPADFVVVSVEGRTTVISGKLNNGNTALDISTLQPGIYFLKAQNSSAAGIWKFIKE